MSEYHRTQSDGWVSKHKRQSNNTTNPTLHNPSYERIYKHKVKNKSIIINNDMSWWDRLKKNTGLPAATMPSQVN